MTTFFTADLHFGHENIIKFCDRPWDNIEDMTEGLVERWNETVEPTDTVFVLGDVAFKLKSRPEFLNAVGCLNGTKILLAGNHDSCWEWSKNALAESKRYYDAGFHLVNRHGYDTVMIDDELVDMCHFPYEGDSHEADRFKDKRPLDNGRWLIHGHVHDSWKIRNRQINVGVDVWDYRPVAESTIIDIMKGNL